MVHAVGMVGDVCVLMITGRVASATAVMDEEGKGMFLYLVCVKCQPVDPVFGLLLKDPVLIDPIFFTQHQKIHF